jgi:cytochrome c-type biogenesis protein CcmF
VWTYVRGGLQGDAFPAWQHAWPTYPLLFLGWLIITTLTWELIRTVRAASKGSGRDPVSAFVRLVTFQNRRYGGYLVHVGLAVIAMGVTLSSMYRTTTEVVLAERATAQVGPYELRLGELTHTAAHPGQAYHSTRASLTVLRDGEEVASLAPEKRLYPRTGHRVEEQPTTEVEIARRANEDVYVYFERQADDKRLKFTVFRNPCMWLVWAGWLTMIVGGAFAALPLGGKRVGLAA